MPSAKLENILNELIIGSSDSNNTAKNEITSEPEEDAKDLQSSPPTRQQEIIINDQEEREEEVEQQQPKHREVSVIVQEIQQQLQFRNERTEVYKILFMYKKIC